MYSLICDGGCNIIDGRMYGSYKVFKNHIDVNKQEQRFIVSEHLIGHESRIDYGIGTSNQAEYLSIISALDYINMLGRIGTLESDNNKDNRVKITIQTDSKLVQYTLTHRWNIIDKALTELCEILWDLLEPYTWTIQYMNRFEIKAILGH